MSSLLGEGKIHDTAMVGFSKELSKRLGARSDRLSAHAAVRRSEDTMSSLPVLADGSGIGGDCQTRHGVLFEGHRSFNCSILQACPVREQTPGPDVEVTTCNED